MSNLYHNELKQFLKSSPNKTTQGWNPVTFFVEVCLSMAHPFKLKVPADACQLLRRSALPQMRGYFRENPDSQIIFIQVPQ